MDYEVVTLAEKKVVGISTRTNNFAPDMGEKIGQLWQQFYDENIYPKIPNTANAKALGIYTEYEADEKADYTVMVACEVSETSDGFETRLIKAGKYAKFVVKAEQDQVFAEVAAAWHDIWQMVLPRSFDADFEEYQESLEKDAEVHIYIGLKA